MTTKLIFVLFLVLAVTVCLSWGETHRVKRGGHGGGGGGGGYGGGPGAGGGARGPVYFCGYVGGKEGSGEIMFDPYPVRDGSKSDSPKKATTVKATVATKVADQKSKETVEVVKSEPIRVVESSSISRKDDGWDEYIYDLHKHPVITFLRS